MSSENSDNTIIIYSSARKNGNTSQQVGEYVERSPVSVVYLDEFKILPYRYDQQYESDDFYTLFDNLLTYQHWVFASPVYWYSTTSQMKLFIDRITDYMDQEALQPKLRDMRSKQFSLLSNSIMSAAPNAFIDMFKHTFTYLGMEFVEHHHQRMV